MLIRGAGQDPGAAQATPNVCARHRDRAASEHLRHARNVLCGMLLVQKVFVCCFGVKYCELLACLCALRCVPLRLYGPVIACSSNPAWVKPALGHGGGVIPPVTRPPWTDFHKLSPWTLPHIFLGAMVLRPRALVIASPLLFQKKKTSKARLRDRAQFLFVPMRAVHFC